ncbi:carboxymuconolactone decarboxylase family protein [Pseudoduganella namucuonensis]|uniref:Carboxymuconolactone decarboxylase family protein n=1 Tax=Pseudoduganella namucuonensis TaxID=1035707 RepID=A0A1I7K5P6_9BURK|nr:carboxymuconolactone decarboxylase family protein [Pseudoduganella namucuonensis]SFU92763.1 Carboxymuconolactone decarboxylase family protein [Pseudoduganella namucuonensis]
MHAPRIAPVEGPYAPAIREAFDRVMPPGMEPLNLFKTMAHSPRVLQRMFAGNLLDPGPLSLKDRETLILRTCARCGCDYEWAVHAALFSRAAELSPAEMAATRADDPDALLLRVADELHDGAALSDRTWEALSARYGPGQILEILALCGYYHAISFIANGCRVAAEPFARATGAQGATGD